MTDKDTLIDESILFSVPAMRRRASGLLPRMIVLLHSEAESGLAVMGAAAAAADACALREAAHRLKSASGALGAMRVHALARDIENAARGGYADFDESDRRELEQALQDTFDALEKLNAALPSGTNESVCRAD